MEFFYLLIKGIKDNLILILIIVLLIVINDAILLSDLYSLKTNDKVENTINESDTNNEESSFKTFKIDIKGEVKKPGVYLVNDKMNVSDAIALAGGLKKNATTNNINLSKSLKEEMVIIVSKKSKITKENNTLLVKNDINVTKSEVIGLIEDTNNIVNNNSLININTAPSEELQKLTGIGKSKADAIIAYRENNTFNKIEDILNVPGIGDTLFEKFKDQICV